MDTHTPPPKTPLPDTKTVAPQETIAPNSSPRSARALDLLLLFGAPIIVVLLAAALVFTPRLFAHPSHDFIYTSCPEYYCDETYKVTSGGMIAYNYNEKYSDNIDPNLFYYDAKADTSRKISVADAMSYRLDDSATDPDGYKFEQSYGESGFLVWSSDSDYNFYLADGAKKRKINLTYSEKNSSVDFVGWVTK